MSHPQQVRVVAVDQAGLIDQDLSCGRCAHNLRGSPLNGSCPQCNMPLVGLQAKTPPVPEKLLDDAGTVIADVSCRRCGYNLRGLSRDGRCPECATPVAPSVQRDLLRYAEPKYVRRIARGNSCIWVGLILALLSSGLLYAGYLVAPAFADSASDSLMLIAAAAGVLLGAASLFGIIAFFCGLWMITAPEPSVFGARQRDRSARLARRCLLASVVGVGTSTLVDLLVPPVPIMALNQVVGLTFAVLGVIGVVAHLQHVRSLALRLPNQELTNLAGWLARTLGIVLSVLLFFCVIETLIAWGPTTLDLLGIASSAPVPTTPSAMSTSAAPPTNPLASALVPVEACIGRFAAFILLMSLIGLLRLHRRLRKPLRKQADLAEAHWHNVEVLVAAPPPPQH